MRSWTVNFKPDISRGAGAEGPALAERLVAGDCTESGILAVPISRVRLTARTRKRTVEEYPVGMACVRPRWG